MHRILFLLPLLSACPPPANFPSEAITPDNCDQSFTDDAPDFFRDYFACVQVSATTDAISVFTTNEPPYPSYYYGEGHPNYAEFDYTRGDEYDPNPNTLAAQAIFVTIPTNPVANGTVITTDTVDGEIDTSEDEYPMGPVGIGVDSVLLFNAFAAPGHDIAEERFTFDDYGGHPSDHDEYHHHTSSSGALYVLQHLGLVSTIATGSAELELYGIMCDGTVVMGCTELDGTSIEGTTLDAQGGHVTDLVDTAGVTHFSERYHTHICPSLGGYTYTPELAYYENCAG